MYSDKVEELYLNPINEGKLEEANAMGIAGNLLYEEEVTIYLRIEEDKIKKATFEVKGSCAAIAVASATTQMIQNKTIEEAFHMEETKIIDYLKGLPQAKINCIELTLQAIQKAIISYIKQQEDNTQENGECQNCIQICDNKFLANKNKVC